MDKATGPSDEGELTSEASMTPVRLGGHSQGKGESCEAIMSLADNLAQVVSLGESENVKDGNTVRTAKRCASEDSITTKKPLHLLDLPMDILQVIVKEVS
jgi:hypothetical protein